MRQYADNIGRFVCPDPLWEKYAGWTPYQYCRNNAINLLDNNGKYAWVANLNYNAQSARKSAVRTTPYVFNRLSDYGFEGKYSSMSQNEATNLTDKINALEHEWKSSAPRAAEYLVNTKIPVAITEGLFSTYYQHYTEGASIPETYKILIDSRNLLDDSYKALILHEIVHKFGNNQYGEFGSLTAEFTLGYMDEDKYLQYINGRNNYVDNFKMPEDFNQYFGKRGLLMNKDAFINAARNYGSSILK